MFYIIRLTNATCGRTSLTIEFSPHTLRTPMSKSEFKTLHTWDCHSRFCYAGSVKEGTLILYGGGFSKEIPASVYQRMIAQFSGRTVCCETSRSSPKSGSLGMWLGENVSNAAVASFVGAILVSEGYAKKRCNEIEFP